MAQPPGHCLIWRNRALVQTPVAEPGFQLAAGGRRLTPALTALGGCGTLTRLLVERGRALCDVAEPGRVNSSVAPAVRQDRIEPLVKRAPPGTAVFQRSPDLA